MITLFAFSFGLLLGFFIGGLLVVAQVRKENEEMKLKRHSQEITRNLRKTTDE